MSIVHETSRQRKSYPQKVPRKDRPAWLVDAVRYGTASDWSIALGYAANHCGGFEAFYADMMDVQHAAGAAARACNDPRARLWRIWTWARQIVKERPSKDVRGVIREDVIDVIASHMSYVPSGGATAYTTAKTIGRVLHVLDERAMVVGPDVAMGCRLIAELAGCSAPTAGLALKALEADSIIRKTGKDGRGKKATPYVLCKASVHSVQNLTRTVSTGRTNVSPGVPKELRKDHALAYGQRRDDEDQDQDQVQTSSLRTSAIALAPTTSVYVKNNIKGTFDGSTIGRVHAAISAAGTAGDGFVDSPLSTSSIADMLGVSR